MAILVYQAIEMNVQQCLCAPAQGRDTTVKVKDGVMDSPFQLLDPANTQTHIWFFLTKPV